MAYNTLKSIDLTNFVSVLMCVCVCVCVCACVCVFIYLLTFSMLHYMLILHAVVLSIHYTVTYI